MMATTPGGSFPVIGISAGVDAGTNGVLSGDAVLAVIETPEDLAAYKGKLKGKFVLTHRDARGAGAVDAAGAALHRRAAAALEAETDRPAAAAAAAAAVLAAPADRADAAARRASRARACSSSRTKACSRW